MASSAAKAGDSDAGAGEGLPRSKRLRGKVDADDGQDAKRSRLDAEAGDAKADVGHDGEKETERWRGEKVVSSMTCCWCNSVANFPSSTTQSIR